MCREKATEWAEALPEIRGTGGWKVHPRLFPGRHWMEGATTGRLSKPQSRGATYVAPEKY